MSEDWKLGSGDRDWVLGLWTRYWELGIGDRVEDWEISVELG